MGVRKLQSYCEKELPPSGFRRVKIADLRDTFKGNNPDAPVELLFDVECCLSHLEQFASTDLRYGGEMAGMVQLLRNFYDKFNQLGIEIIAFFGSFKGKDHRPEWIKRRYRTIEDVLKLMNMVREESYEAPKINSYSVLMPSEEVSTSASIIRFQLGKPLVFSFTDNDMEIMGYARANNSFGVLSQDTDFIIANGAQYYLSMQHLDLVDMTTCIYDRCGLAQHLQLQLNQLPLFSTMMGNDIMHYDLMKNFHKSISQFKNGKLDLDKFVRNIAEVCREVECDEEGTPKCREDLSHLAGLIRADYHGNDNPYTFIMDSLHSYRNYFVEKELRVDRVDQPGLIALALTLYRQGWITCDLLLLICRRECQMSTCIEIFDERNVRRIGDILAKLRIIVYGATFGGYQSQKVSIKEFVITGPKCLDYKKAPVCPYRVPCVRNLEDVWRQSLKPGSRPMHRTSRPLSPCVTVDEWMWEKIPESIEPMRKYMVTVLAQSCNLQYWLKDKLLSHMSDLPQSVLIPMFTFLYLDTEYGVYLSAAERESVLITFSLVAILSSDQVEEFQSVHLNKKAESVELIRISNLFMKSTQLMVNLNAVCGFPIPLDKVYGHNYWQGSFVQRFYEYLNNEGKQLADLYKLVCSVLKNMDTAQGSGKNIYVRNRFILVMKTWEELGLCKMRR